MEKYVAHSYRLQTCYALFALQTENTSALQAITNISVMKNSGQLLQQTAIPVLPAPPTIMLSSSPSESDDGDEGDESHGMAENEEDDDATGSEEQGENKVQTSN